MAGWCDKAFRYLAGQCSPALPSASSQPFAADCTFAGETLQFQETPAAITSLGPLGGVLPLAQGRALGARADARAVAALMWGRMPLTPQPPLPKGERGNKYAGGHSAFGRVPTCKPKPPPRQGRGQGEG